MAPDADCSRIQLSPSWQALLISHMHFRIWPLWGKHPIIYVMYVIFTFESQFFCLTLAILFRHDVVDDWNVPPGQRWFAHRNHVAWQAKFKHRRISQEKKPKIVNNLFCWCLSMSFCSSIFYTILQTRLNTSMLTIPPGQPTWRWTERSESSESSENLEERRRGNFQNLSKNRWYKRSSNRCLLTALAQSWWDCSVGSKTWQETSCKKVNVWMVTKADLQPEAISTAKFYNSKSPAKPLRRVPSHAVVQRTEVSSPWLSAVLRVWKSQRFLHLWHLHQINEYQWIELNQQTPAQFVVSDSKITFCFGSFGRLHKHVAWPKKCHDLQLEVCGVASAWPSRYRRKPRHHRPDGKGTWCFSMFFFMTNKQTNQKQSLNLEQKKPFFSTYCCCFLFQSSQGPVRPFLWYRHLTNQKSQNLIGISSSMLGTGGGSTFFTSLASCALPMAWISLQPAALQLFSRAAALRVVGEIWMFIHFRTQESLK